ncbi:transglutaminase family protein [Variovorax dokdonensis]|uniref:Transglutaminase family protein n=1 Tax=Variovorax dokdonensis TaxID=344883 RepID=A0ABT7N5R2_9BURK|nr:transglutaminase family protein [Variovorax dokdonensis]MDM0043294.1 transglutaminase family protein [Variovorax dokdonensis]
MLIKIGYDIELALEASTAPSALVFLVQVHPTRAHDLVDGEHLSITPGLSVDHYRDGFDNKCARVQVPPGIGRIRLRSQAVIRDSGLHDVVAADAQQCPLDQLPTNTLQYLLPSRYCEVDSELLAFAWQQFGNVPAGWARVQAICDFVHGHLSFSYQNARSTRTAVDGFRERTGVCRDFTHLAVALCRCMNIPARYVTGYLGDIGVPIAPYPMDYSAWFEVYLGDRWYTFDARHNTPRIGRIPVAHGRDAADVPITMFFGNSKLERFDIVTDEIAEQPQAAALA